MAGLKSIRKAHKSKGVKIDSEGLEHPGILLQREFDRLKILQKEAAALLGIRSSNLSDVVRGVRGFSLTFVLRLEKVFNFDPHYWIALQIKHDLALLRKDYRIVKALSTVKKYGDKNKR